MNNKKKDFGINLKTVSCPKSWKEVLWGGYICNDCDCKMDKYGKEIKV